MNLQENIIRLKQSQKFEVKDLEHAEQLAGSK